MRDFRPRPRRGRSLTFIRDSVLRNVPRGTSYSSELVHASIEMRLMRRGIERICWGDRRSTWNMGLDAGTDKFTTGAQRHGEFLLFNGGEQGDQPVSQTRASLPMGFQPAAS